MLAFESEKGEAMTKELKALMTELNSTFFRYAQITGALEFYMLVLETPALQLAVSKTLTDTETTWKQIHRFMDIGGQRVTWYPELPVSDILKQKLSLLGYLYGVTLSRMIGDLDYYLASVLKGHFAQSDKSGSCWELFVRQTQIDLLKCQHCEFVYTLLQERHKIEHDRATIDRVFLERFAKRNVKTTYSEGDSIQKSHVDVLLANQVIREFATNVDVEVAKLLPPIP